MRLRRHEGRYVHLTKPVTDSGNGPCITLDGNNITLNLDSHTIVGTGTDTCILVEGGSSTAHRNEAIVGGTTARPATLTNCDRGVNVNLTSGTTAKYLNIFAPVSFGVFANAARGMVLSTITVPLQKNDASGFYFEHGANNVVTHATVGNNGAEDSFYAFAETRRHVHVRRRHDHRPRRRRRRRRVPRIRVLAGHVFSTTARRTSSTGSTSTRRGSDR